MVGFTFVVDSSSVPITRLGIRVHWFVVVVDLGISLDQCGILRFMVVPNY